MSAIGDTEEAFHRVRHKVPALEGRTALQAVQDPDGKEIVESLLLDWERRGAYQAGIRPGFNAVRKLLNPAHGTAVMQLRGLAQRRLFDETINLIYGLQDTLVRNITSKQWKTIHAVLDEPTKLEDIAEELNLNVSTVSRNLRRGYYWQLAETTRIAGSIIQKTFPNLHVKVQNS
jgi:hypothetical protein